MSNVITLRLTNHCIEHVVGKMRRNLAAIWIITEEKKKERKKEKKCRQEEIKGIISEKA